ncbi:central glycolytic regulator [Clostridium homopropionicum DSM 5847]|uniref:Central glycolytic regulator n=1 Tax=Clostridium homopropionicum DSM 5847 TaxID=1121318 RepID=A0A0L6ZCP6_9CLOT|nr:sugar-binding domain-containing protein [Clostridium homopropionicum]KOA20749.1 central glycolytic regulator [Clostridium homopropionicum DSM 5847]SFF89999.1 central glycolytic genes regulator [Clostridium homopropionicum]
MKYNLELQKKIVPEALELMEKRYNILNTILYNQPIGRRLLATYLGIGERIVRSEVDFLKKQGLLEIKSDGMTLNADGKDVLFELKEYLHELKGLSNMEEFIRKALNIKNVIVVPGDSDENSLVLDEMGKSAANYLLSIIQDNNIIAMTGGTSVKKMVDSFQNTTDRKGLLIVPARGGLGREVEIQANTLVARLADKLSCDYKMLQLLDNVDYAEIFEIINEESIKEVVNSIHLANILIYGIGKADNMAKKRGLERSEIEKLEKLGAVGEAFGCYFNRSGDIVYSKPTAGIKSEDTKKIKNLIAIAGGKSKAEAIIAAERYISKNTLILDEGAAKEIINIIKNENTNKELL